MTNTFYNLINIFLILLIQIFNFINFSLLSLIIFLNYRLQFINLFIKIFIINLLNILYKNSRLK